MIFSITEIPSHTHRHQHGSNTNKVMFKAHLLLIIFKLIELRNILTLGLGTIPKLYNRHKLQHKRVTHNLDVVSGLIPNFIYN